MIDPLKSFNWTTLHKAYDSRGSVKLMAFKGGATKYLRCQPVNDRMLYYHLVNRFGRHQSTGIQLRTYERMLYWKLYSIPSAVKNVCEPLKQNANLRRATKQELIRIAKRLPATLSQNVDDIILLLTNLTTSLHGMTSSCDLPVRTTFLHFAYPKVVPILDKQVLKAVGVHDKNANHSYEILREYFEHAWWLVDKYKASFKIFANETPIRIIDMALWLSR